MHRIRVLAVDLSLVAVGYGAHDRHPGRFAMLDAETHAAAERATVVEIAPDKALVHDRKREACARDPAA